MAMIAGQLRWLPEMYNFLRLKGETVAVIITATPAQQRAVLPLQVAMTAAAVPIPPVVVARAATCPSEAFCPIDAASEGGGLNFPPPLLFSRGENSGSKIDKFCIVLIVLSVEQGSRIL